MNIKRTSNLGSLQTGCVQHNHFGAPTWPWSELFLHRAMELANFYRVWPPSIQRPRHSWISRNELDPAY
jgi:hypothetical protein